MASRLPVTVIGGYLGAGKTTLVNRTLRQANGLRLAVLVNEFGDLPIDADLIEAQDEGLISISGGCICCSYGSDLMGTLMTLPMHPSAPQHVLIEASGVALPGAVARSVGLVAGLALDGVVVMVDAETILTHADSRYLADTVERQVSEADLVLVNKADLVTTQHLVRVDEWLASQAPYARAMHTVHADVPLSGLLGTGIEHDFAPNVMTPHAHYETRSFVCDPIDDIHTLGSALTAPELGVLRAKGFVRDRDGHRHLLQVVGPRFEVSVCDDDGLAEGIVVIGVRELMDIERVSKIFAPKSSAVGG
ncbi:MAG: GTP-binding protein [Chromatiales bacterium]|jgi:G3E family GTPase|nr:GTP-binding protein [Chromatiales bacterium]